MSTSNITALILTVGEESYSRALTSVNTQSLKPAEIITVSNIRPFYKALNQGALQVKTDFFVQVDSDMVLDNDCFEYLLKSFDNGVGVVIGQLRDRLTETVTGVKMFRAECFYKVIFKNVIAPDTVFYNDIKKYGWDTWRVLNLGPEGVYRSIWYTFGEHNPEYNLKYTCNKFFIFGMRHRYWSHLAGIKYILDKLANNSEDISYVAQLAFCSGFLNEESHKIQEISLPETTKFYNDIQNLIKKKNDAKNIRIDYNKLNSIGKLELFTEFHNLGQKLKDALDLYSLKMLFDGLDNTGLDSWFLKLALCSGLNTNLTDSTNISRINFESVMDMACLEKNRDCVFCF